MGSFVLNLDEIESTSFELMPKGNYLAEVDSVTWKRSKGGDAMLVWRCTVIEGEYEGRKLPRFYSMLEGRGVGMTKPLFESFALSGAVEFAFDEGGDEEDGFDVTYPEFVGASVNIKLGIEKYNDENRNNVLSILAADHVAPAPAPASAASAQTNGTTQRPGGVRRFK